MQPLCHGVSPRGHPAVLLTEEEKAGAPESFVTVPAKGLGKDALPILPDAGLSL